MKSVYEFFKKHTWVFILVACIVFIPQSFNYQAKLNMRVIVTGLAIDKSNNEFEVTAQVVMPSSGSESGGSGARLDFISEKGDNVAEGIQKIAYKIGKVAALSHMSFVMVGQDMLSENLATALDFFARDAHVAPAVSLLICEGKAKDTLIETKNLELGVGIGLQKVFLYKQGSLNGFVMPLEEFINNAFSLSKSAMVSGVVIKEEGMDENSLEASQKQEQSPMQQSTSGSSQQSSSGSSEEKKARIKFYNDIYYFKNGKYINKLNDEKSILGVFWADLVSNSGDFKISHVTGGVLNDATIGLEFSNKSTTMKVDFKEGKPVFNVNINIKEMQITEILNKDRPTLNIYDSQDEEIIKKIKAAAKKEIRECVQSAFEKSQQDNVDIFDIGEKAYQTKSKEWKKYYEEKGENYLKDIRLKVNVKIRNFN